MATNSYLPNGDADRVVWLNNFAATLANFSTTLHISSTELQSVKKDAAMFSYIVNLTDTYKQMLQHVVAHKKILSHVSTVNTVLGAIPALPTLAAAPTAVPAGIFDRITSLVGRIKRMPTYNESIGQSLNIISPVQTVDIDTLQPILNIKLDAGRPHIKCAKGYADAIDIYVDRKDAAGFVFLARLLRMDYIDLGSLPANVLLAEWDYKASYVIGNDQVGKYSPVVSIVVKK